MYSCRRSKSSLRFIIDVTCVSNRVIWPGKLGNCTGQSALSSVSKKVYFFLRFSSEKPTYFYAFKIQERQIGKVGVTKNGIHSGMGHNIMPVPASNFPEMLIQNLFFFGSVA